MLSQSIEQKRRQMIPPQVALKHKQWHSELLKVRDPKTTDLILAIHEFVEEQKMHKDLSHGGNSYNKYTTNWNVIPLNKKWIGIYNMYPNLKDKAHQVRYFNKAIKLLIQAQVLVEYDDIEGYMINPLYLCANSNCYVNMYTKWCSLTNTTVNNCYLENSVFTYNGFKKQLEGISATEINIYIQQNNYIVY